MCEWWVCRIEVWMKPDRPFSRCVFVERCINGGLNYIMNEVRSYLGMFCGTYSCLETRVCDWYGSKKRSRSLICPRQMNRESSSWKSSLSNVKIIYNYMTRCHDLICKICAGVRDIFFLYITTYTVFEPGSKTSLSEVPLLAHLLNVNLDNSSVRY